MLLSSQASSACSPASVSWKTRLSGSRSWGTSVPWMSPRGSSWLSSAYTWLFEIGQNRPTDRSTAWNRS